MELLSVVLLTVGGIIASSFLLLLSWAIYYDFSKSKIPPGFDHPFKLRILHWVCIMLLTSEKILEALGVCKRPSVIRLVDYLWKSPMDPDVSSKDLEFDGVKVRVYYPKAPCAGQRRGLLFFHGGLGVIGKTGLYDDVCCKLCKDSGTVVAYIDYPLDAKHSYPTQQEDCLTATVHFMKNAEAYGVDPSRIILCGDSAGANFLSIVAHKLVERSDLPKLRGQVLLYPCLQGMDFSLPSYQQNGTTPLLFRDTIIEFGLMYLRKDLSLKDEMLKGSYIPDDLRLKYGKWVSGDHIPERFKSRGYQPVSFAPYRPEVNAQLPEVLHANFSSLLAEDSVLQKLPDTFIVSCELDVLRDDALLYKKRLEDNGVKVTWFHAKHGFHGVIHFMNVQFLSFPTATEILDKANGFLRDL